MARQQALSTTASAPARMKERQAKGVMGHVTAKKIIPQGVMKFAFLGC